jgi:hypothetical protein
MADENKLATFKWFSDTYTCGELVSGGISDTIFNYNIKSDKVINYKDLITPENYKGYNTTIADETNFVDNGGNTKCILQSHIEELINTKHTFKIGFQKDTLFYGLHSGKDCLYIKMMDLASTDTPPDSKLKIKIIIYNSVDDEIGKSYIVYIPAATGDKDYTYIIHSDDTVEKAEIYRVEIVATSVYRSRESSPYIVQPQIEYYYTYNLVGYISAAKNYDDGNFNGSEITKGGRIDIFVSNGGNTPGSGGSGGGSGDSTTQKDLVIKDNWVNLDTVVNNQSNLKICWAAVEYIINENTILICNDYDIFMGVKPIYALLSNSAEIIERINSISNNDYNNGDKYIYIAFEELYNSEKYKSEIDGLENYEYANDLPDPLPELELTGFIDYGDNLIKPDKNE